MYVCLFKCNNYSYMANTGDKHTKWYILSHSLLCSDHYVLMAIRSDRRDEEHVLLIRIELSRKKGAELYWLRYVCQRAE